MRLIDADALKQEIRKGTRYFVRVWDTKGREKWEMEKELSLKEIDEIIDNTPTIDAEPIRHGKWIDEAEDWRKQIEWFKCSQCDFPTFTAYKFCPYCGAQMEGVEE